jgi:hypothetical protein
MNTPDIADGNDIRLLLALCQFLLPLLLAQALVLQLTVQRAHHIQTVDLNRRVQQRQHGIGHGELEAPEDGARVGNQRNRHDEQDARGGACRVAVALDRLDLTLQVEFSGQFWHGPNLTQLTLRTPLTSSAELMPYAMRMYTPK